ncbi:MAG: DUF378 domain-containing protein [Microgenomates group bacterium]|jgi:hypothetical protein|nr:DUF378 domain-containing protein [Candidatus Woesebacteria bacterium]MBP6883392.1 DUF378 domain-containing protein [Candidatus Woesebacteria bacterium]QQR63814.1 MAG: DUF378 domain-containing protein [Candidatus Roizmanbacteria bacterium]
MKWLHMVSFLLMVVGAVTWGTVALFQFNVVDMVFGVGSQLGMVVYVLVGVSGLYQMATHKGDCKVCSK